MKLVEKILENSNTLDSKTYKKGEYVAGTKKNLNSLGYVVFGKLKAKNVMGNKNVPLSEFKEGDIFGAASLFLKNGKYSSEIFAEEDSEILFISEEKLTEFIKSDPEFALEYVKFLTSKIQLLNKKISGFTSKTANDKLMLYLANNNGIIANCDMTKLAKTLGIGRASLYRAIFELEAEKMIKKNGKDLIKL